MDTEQTMLQPVDLIRSLNKAIKGNGLSSIEYPYNSNAGYCYKTLSLGLEDIRYVHGIYPHCSVKGRERPTSNKFPIHNTLALLPVLPAGPRISPMSFMAHKNGIEKMCGLLWLICGDSDAGRKMALYTAALYGYSNGLLNSFNYAKSSNKTDYFGNKYKYKNSRVHYTHCVSGQDVHINNNEMLKNYLLDSSHLTSMYTSMYHVPCVDSLVIKNRFDTYDGFARSSSKCLSHNIPTRRAILKDDVNYIKFLSILNSKKFIDISTDELLSDLKECIPVNTGIKFDLKQVDSYPKLCSIVSTSILYNVASIQNNNYNIVRIRGEQEYMRNNVLATIGNTIQEGLQLFGSDMYTYCNNSDKVCFAQLNSDTFEGSNTSYASSVLYALTAFSTFSSPMIKGSIIQMLIDRVVATHTTYTNKVFWDTWEAILKNLWTPELQSVSMSGIIQGATCNRYLRKYIEQSISLNKQDVYDAIDVLSRSIYDILESIRSKYQSNRSDTHRVRRNDIYTILWNSIDENAEKSITKYSFSDILDTVLMCIANPRCHVYTTYNNRYTAHIFDLFHIRDLLYNKDACISDMSLVNKAAIMPSKVRVPNVYVDVVSGKYASILVHMVNDFYEKHKGESREDVLKYLRQLGGDEPNQSSIYSSLV